MINFICTAGFQKQLKTCCTEQQDVMLKCFVCTEKLKSRKNESYLVSYVWSCIKFVYLLYAPLRKLLRYAGGLD